MKLLVLVCAELRYRPLSALLTTFVCGAALTILILVTGISTFLETQTKKIQRDIGLNVRILPADADLARYWNQGFADGKIDQRDIEKVEQQSIANRLIPVLQKQIPWGDSHALLTGIGEERFADGKQKKRVFGSKVKQQSEVVLGAAAAQALGLVEGDFVKIGEQEFQVSEVLATEGTIDDIRVHIDLSSVQRVLNLEGYINEIRALECNCEQTQIDPEEELRRVLAPILPGTQIVRQDRMADARRQQRQLAARIAATMVPAVLGIAIISVFGLVWMNSNERQQEFAIYSTLGYSDFWMSCLAGLRTSLLGACGGAFGGCIGLLLLSTFVGDGFLSLDWDLQGGMPPGFYRDWLVRAFVIGTIVGILGGLLPIMLNVFRDPVKLLRG